MMAAFPVSASDSALRGRTAITRGSPSMTDTLAPVKPGRLLINGEPVDAASGKTFTTYNPATEFSIPTGWETVAYDDSAWPEGPAGLGLDVSVNGVPILTPVGYSARS